MSLFRLKRMFLDREASPTLLLVSWFAGLILLGTILLWLPVSHREGGPAVGLLTSLFTATSAACVTGLVTVDTADAFSLFGQAVILILIEMGGLGVMTFANLGFQLFRRRLSMSHQAALADSIFQSDAARDFRRSFRRMLKTVFFIQFAGVCLIFLFILPGHLADGRGFWFSLWSAVFHSVSAFCNAGFSIYRDNLVPIAGNTPFMATILLLLVLGGIGHTVLMELSGLPQLIRREIRRPHWLSLNAKVVLSATAILLVGGCLAVWLGSLGRGFGLGHSVFQAVSARTAGFNSTSLEHLALPATLAMIVLMFIGGSPGSCAGGVKTTSIAIWFARIKANLRHDTSVNIFGYTIAPELVSRARILMALSVLWNLFGVAALAFLQEGERLEVILFEQISAFGTVGLTMGLTPRLDELSQLWIILTMFVGRLGPLTVILWVVPHTRANIHRPIGRVMVG